MSDLDADVALLEIMRDALNVTLLLREVSQLPVMPEDEALARIYRRGRLAQLRCLIERSIDLLDALDGDPDMEDSDPQEEDADLEDDESSWQEDN